MTTLAVVRKAGQAAIAADSVSSAGSLVFPGDMKLSPRKILKLGRAYVGLVGSTAHQRVLQSAYRRHRELFDFSSADSVFETFRQLHPVLKDEYYVETSEDDDDQEYESNQLHGLICAPSGIFLIHSYREVTEFKSFWACGSGAEFALGALEAMSGSNASAITLAKDAVRIACKFDKGSELPLQAHAVKLATG